MSLSFPNILTYHLSILSILYTGDSSSAVLSVLLEEETGNSENFSSLSISLSSLFFLPCVSCLDPSSLPGILDITMGIRANGWHILGH